MYIRGLGLDTEHRLRAPARLAGLPLALLSAGMAGQAGAALAGVDAAGMTLMADDELADINAQGALVVADKILPGGGTGGGTTSSDFTFYRMGLDVQLAMNMNIDKLRLGCGGVNDRMFAGGTNGAVCDVSVDYARFMGVDASGNQPGSAVDSDFLLNRPYVEIAVKNDGSRGAREVVGIKIGSQWVEGMFSMGRTYQNGETNQENGQACAGGPTGRDPDCHSGVNYLSGYVRAEISGNGRLQTTGFLGGDSALVCFGYTRSNTTDPCGPADAILQSAWGTRMNRLLLVNIGMKTYNANGLLNGLGIDKARVDISESLRFMHEIAFTRTGTRDFFMSFQRERVRYPIFDQANPYDTGHGVASRFSREANTGWWMNIPYAAILETQAGYVYVGAVSALTQLSEGIDLYDLPLGQIPAPNCYGSTHFC